MDVKVYRKIENGMFEMNTAHFTKRLNKREENKYVSYFNALKIMVSDGIAVVVSIEDDQSHWQKTMPIQSLDLARFRIGGAWPVNADNTTCIQL